MRREREPGTAGRSVTDQRRQRDMSKNAWPHAAVCMTLRNGAMGKKGPGNVWDSSCFGARGWQKKMEVAAGR